MAGRRDVRLVEVAAGETARVEQMRALFVEYAGTLGVDLSFQGFDAEMEAFPAGYRPPEGALVLALADALPAGGVGMRRLDEACCEMKRLYVRPDFRGLGLGRRLAQALIAAAGRAGYARMRLDTLPHMAAARGLYSSLGFAEIPAYYNNPVPGTSYFELAL